MSADERTLGERVAEMAGIIGGNAATLLLEQQAEMERLTKERKTDADVIALRAACESLREDCDRWRDQYAALQDGNIGVLDERDSLRRDLEAARVDAERYRWLREHTVAAGLGQFMRMMRRRFLDDAIDLARARGEGGTDD